MEPAYTDKWTKKMWCIYTVGYYSTTKSRNMSLARKWIEMEFIMLSKTSQTEKDKYCTLSLLGEILKSNENIKQARRASIIRKEREMRGEDGTREMDMIQILYASIKIPQ